MAGSNSAPRYLNTEEYPAGSGEVKMPEQHKKAENKGQKRQSNVGNAEVIQQGVDAGACLLVFHIGVPQSFLKRRAGGPLCPSLLFIYFVSYFLFL